MRNRTGSPLTRDEVSIANFSAHFNELYVRGIIREFYNGYERTEQLGFYCFVIGSPHTAQSVRDETISYLQARIDQIDEIPLQEVC